MLFRLTAANPSFLGTNFLLHLSDLPSLNFVALQSNCCPSLWLYSAQSNGILGQGYHYWAYLLAYLGSMSSYSVFVKHLPSKDQNMLWKRKQTNKSTPKLLFAHGAETLMAKVLVRAYLCMAALCQGGDLPGTSAAPTEVECQNTAPSHVLTQQQGPEPSFFFVPWSEYLGFFFSSVLQNYTSRS